MQGVRVRFPPGALPHRLAHDTGNHMNPIKKLAKSGRVQYEILRAGKKLGYDQHEVAQAIYHVAGYLSRIKTPKRMHRWIPREEREARGLQDDGSALYTEPSGWCMTPNNPSMSLLTLSMQLDWDCWDHWALVHDENCTNPRTCPDCGHEMCDRPDDIDLDA